MEKGFGMPIILLGTFFLEVSKLVLRLVMQYGKLVSGHILVE